MNNGSIYYGQIFCKITLFSYFNLISKRIFSKKSQNFHHFNGFFLCKKMNFLKILENIENLVIYKILNEKLKKCLKIF